MSYLYMDKSMMPLFDVSRSPVSKASDHPSCKLDWPDWIRSRNIITTHAA